MNNEQNTSSSNNNNSQTVPSSENVSNNKNEKIMEAICYIPLLFLLPFFLVKDKTKTLKFHLNQGLILSILFVIGYFVVSLLPFITDVAINIWKLIILIFSIIGIINVFNNKEKTLPIIGKILSFI